MKANISKALLIGLIMFTGFSCSTGSTDSADFTDDGPINDDTDPVEDPIESSIEFRKNYKIDNGTYVLNSIVQLSDSSYTLGGMVTGNKNILMNFDKYGNRRWSKIMDNTYTPSGIEKLFLNNEGYIGFRGQDYGNNTSAHIIYFDKEGNVENEILFDQKSSRQSYRDVIRDGDNFLMGGNIEGKTAYKMIDSNGDLIWQTAQLHSTDVFSVTKLSGGSYIGIGGGNFTANEDYLVKLDESGTIVWTKNHRGLKVSAIGNNEFLAITNDESLNSGNLMRFDQEGTVVWTKPLDDFGGTASSPSIINYGNGIFICTYLTERLNLNILVFDENGNELKLHTIKNETIRYTSVAKTVDNGLLIAYTDHFDYGLIKLSKAYIFD